jgi:class 3 adenylate cyclase/tetratricopeptide (TPR) repeat protein
MTARTCENCGAPLPADARFCPRCGAPVAMPTTEERKVVTVLFADLAGSTELAARLDPERFREVIGAFYQMVSGELESLRGRVEKFVGDAVMAVFGLPTSHEDDAIRAIRAGFIIRDRTSRLGESLGLPMPLRVRVGINSGSVATGAGPAGQFFVAGAPVNMATRLEKAAEPDEILVGETTWQLARNSVEFGPARTIEAKGFEEEVMAWPVLELTTRSTRRTIPLVDRRRELALLEETFGRVTESGRAHMMTLLGEAGIGKSRVADEFAAGLGDQVKVLFGRASEFHEDVTFAPVAEMIRQELGVERDTPTAVIREKLHDAVEGCCDPTEVQRVAGRLGLVLGLGTDIREAEPEQFWSENLARIEGYVEGDGREGSRFRAAELRAGLLELVNGMARQGPVVMVFEDLDMAQPELLDLVEQVLRGARRLPLFVVCVARDHLLENRPGWGGGIPDAVTLRLDPLSLEDARELARVAADDLDEATAGRIAAHAGGNPFFIIETTGMLIEEHPEHLIGAAHSHLLPPTVQAVVASRIDHLSEEARDLARKASLFPGARFELSELSLITDPRPETIKALEDSELIVRDRGGDAAWRFRHDVLRDVAYESLPKRERRRLHVQVAEGLAGQDGERYPQSVAWHLEQAARASLDLDPGDTGLAERAVKALRRAGDLARWRMESRTAIDLYERALVLSGPERGWGVPEARILSALGESRYWLGEYDEAERTLTRALQLGGDDQWTQSLALRFLADIALNVREDLDRAEELFNRALQAARHLDEPDQPWVIARVLLMAGWVPYWKRDFGRARSLFDEALQISRENPEEDRWAEARALVSLGASISPVGSEDEVLPLVEEALELGRKMDDPFTIAVAQQSVGNSLRRTMRLEEALPCLDEAIQNFRDLDARWELASALGDRAFVHRLAGRQDEATKDLDAAMELCRRLGEKSLISWTASQLALTRLAMRDREGARKLIEDPAVQPGPADIVAAADLLTSAAVVDLAEGDRERARRRLGEALDAEGRYPRNQLAERVWFVATLLGPEAAGGPEAVEDARQTLEQARWLFAFRTAELAAEAVAQLQHA